MKKKIYCCSDIHGNYRALIEGLDNAGYDENDKDSLLVVLGDLFDRGQYSLSIYEYLKRLNDEGKAIIIKGNHEMMLEDYLDGTSLNYWNYSRNGTNETLADFLHRSSPFESWCFIDKGIENPTTADFAEWIKEARDEINSEYPELLPWLKSLPRYYETKSYIMTHGAIDTDAANWHNPKCEHHRFVDWDALAWDDGSFFGKDINNTDKTVIIGHFGTNHLRDMYNINDEKDPHSILHREDGRIIAIDTTTALTGKVNVLVIEDELLK